MPSESTTILAGSSAYSSAASATTTVAEIKPVLSIPDRLEQPPEMTVWERMFVPAFVLGMLNTLRHMVLGRKITLRYPFVKDDLKVADDRFRGQHRLKTTDYTRTDGTTEERENCVACMMCSTACPAECITIEGEPAPAHWWEDHAPGESGREKRPAVFTIDMLRCIYCGMCEEVCPCDAIELTNKPYDIFSDRADYIFDKQRLLDN